MITENSRSRLMTKLSTGAILLALSGWLPIPAGAATPGGFLTGPDSGDPLDIATRYLLEHHDELGLTLGDVTDMHLDSRYSSSVSGTTHLALRQRHAEIRVYNAVMTVNIAADGSVINVGNRFLPDLARRIDGPGFPALTAREAVEAAARHLGLTISEPLDELGPQLDAERTTSFSDGGISRTEIPVHLVYQPAGKTVRLSWQVDIHERRSDDWWSLRVDASTGEELDRGNYTVHDSFEPPAAKRAFAPLKGIELVCSGVGDGTDDFCVYAMPVEAPHNASAVPDGSERTVESDPWTASSTASQLGWNDTDGAPGAESNITQGNNVNAQKSGYHADGGANRVFNFNLDLTLNPTVGTNVDSAIVNLYYWNNILHDLWHDYGFDPAAGNFQENNYGLGGAGSDSVTANAQATGNCNANFSTPSDGSNPTMNMFTCNITTPSRDGDLDNGVIAHEYWHGISNRLTGGPANVSCLFNSEQAGEGWSDLGGLLMTIEPGDTGADPRGIGTWLLGQGPTGGGVRTQRYSTDFLVNNHTYADISSMAIPHGVGEVWASIVWEVVWDLIDLYGFNPNFYDPWNTGGNNLAMQLIIDGLKLQPCSPGFVDSRNAILAADLALTGGANQCLLWTAFARRGLGYSASQGSSSSTTDQTEAFDVPTACLFDVTPEVVGVCAATSDDAVFTVDVPPGFFTADVSLSASSAPSGASIGFSVNPVPPPGVSVMTVSQPQVDYSITVTGNDGLGHLADDTVDVLVSTAVPGAPTLTSPANGSPAVSVSPTFEWSAVADADDYLLEVATDAGFTTIVESAAVTGTSHPVGAPLTGGTLHFWRVTARNGCGTAESGVFSFTTAPLFCSSTTWPIPDNNPTGASDSLVIPSGGSITDLDLSIAATHTWVGDLVFTLTNMTTGTSVVVFDRPGVPVSTYGCSENNVDVLLDDEGTAGPVEDACPVNTGLDYTPNNPLSAFDGEDLAGTWTLHAADMVGSDTGSVTGWCMRPVYVVLAPEITVDPLSLGFANQTVAGGPTSTQNVTITNDGTAPLNLAGVAITGGDAAHYAIASDTGEASLDPGLTRTVAIHFDPQSVGAKTAALSISSNDTDEPTVNVDLTGTGIAPEVHLDPTSLVFASRVAGAGPGSPRPVTITNIGTAVLTVVDVSLTGPDPGEFVIGSDTGEPTLAPSASRTVTLHFDPSTVGMKYARLTVETDDLGQPTVEVALAGEAVNLADIVFFDGFESGNTSQWSAVTP
jgi:subtilisin-like proprotein convertase family protein